MKHSIVSIYSIVFCWMAVAQATPFRDVICFSGGAQQDDNDRYGASSNRKSTILSLAEKSVSVTASAASLAAQQSGKAAYYLIRPKHVDKQELFGLWRLDQQVEDGFSGESVECSANVELTDRYVVVHREDDRKEKEPWTFTPARWPSQAKIEFRAAAFQFEDGSSERYVYKGVVQRKLAAKSIVKLKGKIYRIERTGWRGKTIKLIQVGTFSARKRLRLEDDTIELDDDDEYDGQDAEYDKTDDSDVEDTANQSDWEGDDEKFD